MTEYTIVIKIKAPEDLPKEIGNILEKTMATAYNHLAAKGIQTDVTAKLKKTEKVG